MARKTTKAALDALERFQFALDNTNEVLRVKATVPAENQADYIREKSAEYFVGVIHGWQSATESVLHDQNCYHGFYYVDHKGDRLTPCGENELITAHPEYRNWRVRYYIK